MMNFYPEKFFEKALSNLKAPPLMENGLLCQDFIRKREKPENGPFFPGKIFLKTDFGTKRYPPSWKMNF